MVMGKSFSRNANGNAVKADTLPWLLSNLSLETNDENLERLRLMAPEIDVVTHFWENLKEVIYHPQPSDRYYRETYKFSEQFLPLSRLNYVLAKETGSLYIYRESNLEKCWDTFTWEDLMVMDGSFPELLEHMQKLQESFRETNLQEKYRIYLQALQNSFAGFTNTQKYIIDSLSQYCDGRFAKVKAIYQHFYESNDVDVVIREQRELGIDTGQIVAQFGPRVVSMAQELSDNAFYLRQLWREHRKKLYPLYVIESSLRRMEEAIILVMNSFIHFKKDFKQV